MATIGDLPEVVGADTPGPVENAGSAEGDPTTVSTGDDMPVITGADTSGPVENAPPGGESSVVGDDSNLLGVDVSTPPTAQGVTGEVDAQHGEVGKELVTAALLTPSAEAGRQVASEEFVTATVTSSFDSKCGGRETGGE